MRETNIFHSGDYFQMRGTFYELKWSLSLILRGFLFILRGFLLILHSFPLILRSFHLIFPCFLLSFVFPLSPIMSQETDVSPGDLKYIGKKFGVIFPSKRKKAPDFAFGDGKKLSGLKGYVVLLNFWSPRCPPCVRELPQLNKLYRELKDRKFIVIGVYPDIDESKVEEIRKKLEITFPLVKDVDNSIREKYRVHAYPLSYIIWKDGKFAGKVIGERKWYSEDIVRFFVYLIDAEELKLSP